MLLRKKVLKKIRKKEATELEYALVYRVKEIPQGLGNHNQDYCWTYMESTRHHLKDRSINMKYLNEPKGEKTMPGKEMIMEEPRDPSK